MRRKRSSKKIAGKVDKWRGYRGLDIRVQDADAYCGRKSMQSGPDHRSSILAKALLAASRPIRMYSDRIWMAMSGVTAVQR